jgi:S-adenosylmethionine/arginine decarboxylase-like enzyme
MLDESHCSVHTYADAGLMAFDFFTCGSTRPEDVWNRVRMRLRLRNARVRSIPRFTSRPDDNVASVDVGGLALARGLEVLDER